MRPKIYLLGDSITEESFDVDVGGWGASLANHFARRADVVLRGYGGYNTRWTFRVIDKLFPAESDGGAPLAVTVFLGANDACLPDRCRAFQHVPIDEYKQNLHSIISFVKKKWPGTCVLLITPPPIDEAARLRHPYEENPSPLPERTNEAAGNYAKACLAVAEQCGIRAVDLWTQIQKLPDWRETGLSDGLHLSKAGNKVVFEEVINKLKEEGITLETLPAHLPLVENIDQKDPLKSFEMLK